LLIIVILKLVCRVLDERVVPRPNSRFSFSPTWGLAFTWHQISTWLYTILANEFWTRNASTSQRAYTSHVFCFQLIDDGSWKFTCYRKKSKLWSLRGIRRQNMIDMHYFYDPYICSLSIYSSSISTFDNVYLPITNGEIGPQRQICSYSAFPP
jgi:hypothetical protein